MCPRWGTASSPRPEMRTGPGNRQKVHTCAPNPSPTIYRSPRDPGQGLVMGKRRRRAGRLTPRSGVHSLQRAGVPEVPPPLAGQEGRSSLGNPEKEGEERAVRAHRQAWTLGDGAQAPGGSARSSLSPGGWAGSTRMLPTTGGPSRQLWGLRVCGCQGITYHFSSLAWVSWQPILPRGPLEGVQRSGAF